DHDIRSGRDVDRQAAFHILEVATLGDDVDRSILDAGFGENVGKANASPFNVADCAISPLRTGDFLRIIAIAAAAVTRALDPGGQLTHLHLLQVIERELQLVVNVPGYIQSPFRRVDIYRDGAIAANKEFFVGGDEIIIPCHRHLEVGRA